MMNNVEDKGLKSAYEDADKHNWTKEELEAYNYVLMREQDDRGRLTLALRREKEAIARNLLKLGLSIEDIVKSTKLTVEQVQKLQSE